ASADADADPLGIARTATLAEPRATLIGAVDAAQLLTMLRVGATHVALGAGAGPAFAPGARRGNAAGGAVRPDHGTLERRAAPGLVKQLTRDDRLADWDREPVEARARGAERRLRAGIHVAAAVGAAQPRCRVAVRFRVDAGVPRR